jgi:2-polyprenyl-3-methyl-5-hydroxy-6-metoxy-1,4-benzoquinol methylase
MTIRKCRVCNGRLFKEPLLVYREMPAISQFLPEKKDFANDRCIDLTICQCSKCGLIQLDNDPVYYFKDVIRSGSVSEEVKKFRTKQFQDFVDTYQLKDKKIVEIGCGRGEYLSIMNRTGAKAFGLEHRVESVEECRTKGLSTIQGFLYDPNQRIEHSPFDAFYICNFLEHIDEPSKLLQAIANNLTIDGIGIVEVPNTDRLLRDKTFYKFTLEHLLNFTQETLETSLGLNGFEVLSCKPIRQGSPLSAIVRKRKPLDFSNFHENQKQLLKEIDAFINKFGSEKIAIWGAGHYTFGILSVHSIENKVKYILDSAPFKQGRYSPKTHIPIVPPETLNANPVKGVIVSAAGYSNEVTKILLNNYDSKIKVAVVRENHLEYMN